MNQMDNKESNVGDVLSSLGDTANKVSSFLASMQGSLTPQQKEQLDRELGGSNAFKSKMQEAQDKLTKAMGDIDKFQRGNFNI